VTKLPLQNSLSKIAAAKIPQQQNLLATLASNKLKLAS
jgi:hypothetical protein